MKVQDLLNEKLGYDPKRKMPTGSMSEWLAAIGASKDDVAKAREEVLKSPEYHELIDIGFEDTSGPGNKSRGSIELTTTYLEPKTITQMVHRKTGEVLPDDQRYSWDLYKNYKFTTTGAKPEFRKVRLKYSILPHGKIDFTAPNDYHRWPVPSGKTRIVPNNPVASIVSSMRMALKDLIRQMANKMEKVRKLEDMIK